jgi:hypothetical protein
MKATLKYNLPEDEFEFNNAVKSMKMYFALTEIKEEIRSVLKYGELRDEQYKFIEEFNEKFHEILNDNEINLDLCL